MPDVTPIYELPYPIGSDPPCFGPGTGCDNLESLWCDFAALVETQLDETDLIVGRTATAIPMAQVSLTNPDETPFFDLMEDFYVPFDTVVFDTDGMADTPFGITPRRNGIYRIEAAATIFLVPPQEDAYNAFWVKIGTEATGPSVNAVTMATMASTPGFANMFIHASTLYRFTDTSPVPRVIQMVPDPLLSPDTEFVSATLTVYWHGDL